MANMDAESYRRLVRKRQRPSPVRLGISRLRPSPDGRMAIGGWYASIRRQISHEGIENVCTMERSERGSIRNVSTRGCSSIQPTASPRVEKSSDRACQKNDWRWRKNNRSTRTSFHGNQKFPKKSKRSPVHSNSNTYNYIHNDTKSGRAAPDRATRQPATDR